MFMYGLETARSPFLEMLSAYGLQSGWYSICSSNLLPVATKKLTKYQKKFSSGSMILLLAIRSARV